METRVPEKLAVRAAPCDFVFDPAKTALLVVDMQRDLIEAAGLAHALGTDTLRLQQIVPTVAELLAVARRILTEVLSTQAELLDDLRAADAAQV